mgnify:CR=1 FL=1
MKKYLVVGLQVLLAVFFFVPGVMKLLGNPELVAVFAGFGYSTEFMYFIGVAEVLGVLGILIGSWVHPRIPTLAIGGLMIIMVGAVYSHLTNGDPFVAAIPAIVNIVLLAVYCKVKK